MFFIDFDKTINMSNYTVFNSFIDFETKYRVEEKTNAVQPADNRIYISIFKPSTAVQITIEERQQILDKQEPKIWNHPPYQVKSYRKIDIETGMEYKIFELINTLNKTILHTTKQIAFFPEEDKEDLMLTPSEILEEYLDLQTTYQARVEQQQEFWDNIYPNYTQEDKLIYWIDYLHKGLKHAVDSYQDDLSVFDESKLLDWYTKEVDIQNILLHSLNHLLLTEEDIVRFQKHIISFFTSQSFSI